MLGVARYHFRTDLDPIPKILSICRYRYRYDTWTVFFFIISVEFLYLNVCWHDHDFFCVTHNLLNIDNFIKEKQQMNAYIIIIYDKILL